MSDKEHQIDEMIKIIIGAIPETNIVDGIAPANEEEARKEAEALYHAGWRKTFTSEFASDTQKAFKEGYVKAQAELENKIENGELVSKDWHDEQVMHAQAEIEQLESENDGLINQLAAGQNEIERLQKKLTDVLVCIKDTDNNIDVERLQKQAVKEFAGNLKDFFEGDFSCVVEGNNVLVGDEINNLIDLQLKEYEK